MQENKRNRNTIKERKNTTKEILTEERNMKVKRIQKIMKVGWKKERKTRKYELDDNTCRPTESSADSHQYPWQGSKKSGAFKPHSLFLPFGWGLHGTGGQWRPEFSPEVCKHRHYKHNTHRHRFLQQAFLGKPASACVQHSSTMPVIQREANLKFGTRLLRYKCSSC